MNYLKKTALTALFIAGFVPLVSTAYIPDKQQVVVPYGDLDLTRQDGKERLYHRLENAARKVCGPFQVRRAGSLEQVARNRACFAEAMANAKDELNISVE